MSSKKTTKTATDTKATAQSTPKAVNNSEKFAASHGPLDEEITALSQAAGGSLIDKVHFVHLAAAAAGKNIDAARAVLGTLTQCYVTRSGEIKAHSPQLYAEKQFFGAAYGLEGREYQKRGMPDFRAIAGLAKTPWGEKVYEVLGTTAKKFEAKVEEVNS